MRRGRIWIFGRQGLNRADLLGKRLRDGLGVTWDPDPRAIDAAAAAVDEDAVGHDVEVFGPVIDFVFAQDNLAEARPMRLHTRIAFVLLDGGRAAKDEAS